MHYPSIQNKKARVIPTEISWSNSPLSSFSGMNLISYQLDLWLSGINNEGKPLGSEISLLQNSRFLHFRKARSAVSVFLACEAREPRRACEARTFSLAVFTLAPHLSFEYYFTVSLALAKNTTVLQSKRFLAGTVSCKGPRTSNSRKKLRLNTNKNSF